MPLRLAVDAERLVGDYLRSRTEVTSLATGGVMTRLNLASTFPVVVFHRAGGKWQDRERLDKPDIQVEAWAGNAEISGEKQNAHDLINVCRAVMNNDPGNIVKVHTLGTVDGTDEVIGPRWEPDQPTGRARYLFIVRVYMHP